MTALGAEKGRSSGAGAVTASSILRISLSKGIRAARANLVPGTVLWIVGLSILGLYFLHEPARMALGELSRWKQRLGLRYSMVSTAVFGGLFPFLVQHLQRSLPRRTPWRHLPYLLSFWAVKGVEVDLWYQFQSWAFGDARDLRTLAIKVTVDQLVFSAIWAVPFTVIGLLWMEHRFKLRGFFSRLGPRWFLRHVVPVLLSNFMVWIPAVAMIYCLPLPLQVPMHNLVLCIWSLMVLFMTRVEDSSEAGPGPPKRKE